MMTGPMWAPTQAPDLQRLLAFHPQPVPLFPIACTLALIAYTGATIRLHRRGDRWPVGRTLAFIGGLISVLAVTGTGIGGYGMRLFSVHMFQHMVLSMLSPVLLLLGAPITLALRTLPGGRRGPRGLLLSILHSRAMRLLTSPLVTIPLFLGSLYGLYFTTLFDVAMSTWWGHDWMLAHFLTVGLLFFWPIVAIDPSPRRAGHGLRLLELLATTPFHAFFGIAVMMSTHPVVGFFRHSSGIWRISSAGDQNTAGSIAWAFGEVPTAILVVLIAVSWAKTSDREARRHDRLADRTGDRELHDYNAYLAALASGSADGLRRIEPAQRHVRSS
ncbi:MAG TPA: cytochrome c oxidase assembly protein [Frankiaceae bacterium]|nr:cytochrome c oxidase assembly protein [Frankiaceae bacterium]